MPSQTFSEVNGPPHSRTLASPVDLRERNLPTPLTTFIGRQQEVSSAIALLQSDDVRLLTLTGPGGAGKTRLALEVASQCADLFPTGIVFVELATTTSPERLLSTIAHEFGFLENSDQHPLTSLAVLLRAKHVLLVLDNFEQIVSAAPSIAELLAACPSLKILIASRTVLNIQGEQELLVPPMRTPEHGPGQTWRRFSPADLAGYDAIALFVQRARAVQPNFTLTTENSHAIVNICRELDGLPLAIELAAARLKILTPEALLGRLASRLDLLVGGARDQPARLRAIRTTIAWSYELLPPDERTLFQQLAVFVGGFTLDAAEAVCRADGTASVDILNGIASLVDNSLLNRTEVRPGELRFQMIETIREFGVEQLAASGREETLRRHHAEWCAELAKVGESRIFGPDDIETVDRLLAEHDNIRSALAWALENGQIETGMRIACWTWPLWFLRSYFVEGRTWMEQLTERAEFSGTSIYALTLALLGILCEALGDFETALERLERAMSLARKHGDPRCLALCTLSLADVVDSMEDFERAEVLFLDATELLRETGEEGWLVSALGNLAILAHRRGDAEAAERCAAEGLDIARRINFAWGIAICLNRQGRFAGDAGNYVEAAGLFQESLLRWRDCGDRWRVSRTLTDLADMAAMTDQYERAVRLLGAAEALNEPLAVSIDFADSSGWRRAHATATASLDTETFQREWAAGYQLSWNEAITEASKPFVDDITQSTRVTDIDIPAANSLSPREQEVLHLLVAGHTDREIADELFISPRTAQGHVANIFNKLGVNSRTAAVATALQRGLLPSGGMPT